MTDSTSEWFFYYEERCREIRQPRKSYDSYELIKPISNQSKTPLITISLTDDDLSPVRMKSLHNKQNFNINHLKENALIPYFIPDELKYARESKIEEYINETYFENNINANKVYDIDITVFNKMFRKNMENIRKYRLLRTQSFNDDNFFISSKCITSFKEEDLSNPEVSGKIRYIKSKCRSHRSNGLEESNQLKSNLIKQSKYRYNLVIRKQSLMNMIGQGNHLDIFKFTDQIEELLNNYMGLLFTSVSIGQEGMKEISVLFRSRVARGNFAAILFQNKFKDNETHLLSPQSFKELKEIVFIALVASEREDNQYTDTMLITKSIFNYYKIVESNKYYFIYQDLIKKVPFNVWMDEDFWRFYFEYEVDDKSHIVHKDKIEELYCNTVISVASCMNNLNLDSELIYKSLNNYVQGMTGINLEFLLK